MSVRPLLGSVKSILAVKDVVVSFYSKNPRLANACTGCLTFSLGDIIAQKLEQQRTGSSTKLNIWRSVQIGALGIAMNSFFLHHWYRSLDRVVGSSMTNRLGVAAKVVADQTIYAPFAITSFFYFTSACNSSSVAEANSSFMDKLGRSFVPTYLADCMLWPASNYVNFRYVSLAYRPSFTAVVQLLWQTYMSTTSSLKAGATEAVAGSLDPSSSGGSSSSSNSSSSDRGEDS